MKAYYRIIGGNFPEESIAKDIEHNSPDLLNRGVIFEAEKHDGDWAILRPGEMPVILPTDLFNKWFEPLEI